MRVGSGWGLVGREFSKFVAARGWGLVLEVVSEFVAGKGWEVVAACAAAAE